MSRLGTLSEIEKLGYTLARDPAELRFLADIPPDELRSLRVSLYERLFQQDGVVFERLARIAPRLPDRLAARLAERVLGPMITARIAAEVPTKAVLDLLNLVSTEFFADTAEFLDPRRLRDTIVQVPVETIVVVALELVHRADFMTISRFIDYVTDEQTQATIDAIEDETAILQVGFYMGSKNRMDHLFRTLSRERLERMIVRVEAQGDALLPQFLSVLVHVSYALKRELGDIIASQHPGVLTGYIRAAQDADLWEEVLPVVATMSADAQRRVVNLPILAEPEVQSAIVQAAAARGNWGMLLGLVRTMGDSNRDAVAKIIAARERGALDQAADAALLGEHWDTLLDLASRMPQDAQQQLGAVVQATIAPHDTALYERIATRATALGIDHFNSDSRSGVRASSAYS
jgi:hypothetical protein